MSSIAKPNAVAASATREVLARGATKPNPKNTIVAAYREVWPLAEGWRDRQPLHQLYPLTAHAALFGGGYGARAARILAALR